MFKKARIKLTLWYVGIILIISSIFSGLIYQRVTMDLEQGFRRGFMRMKVEEYANENKIKLPPPGSRSRNQLEKELAENDFFIDDINQAKHNLLFSIITINGIILLISAAGSYYLAGITLKPIQKAYQNQKRFIADASHELKTPITALKTSLEVNLMNKKLEKTTKKILNENLEDVTNLENLTHSLLKLANQQAVQKLFKPVNIYTQAQKAVKQLKSLADKKNQTINILAKNKKLEINGEENAIFELFLIFLDNAIKYTPEKGKITVKLVGQKKNIQIIIQDTGVGIYAESILHIFDRFYQEDSSRSSQTDSGFGLGLSVAKQIIDQHNGSVNVTSEKEKGTEFIVKFPTI